jgi:sugar phosphate isomerase/epimerase
MQGSTQLSRRRFTTSALSSVALLRPAFAAVPRIGGVRIGLQSASFTYSGMNLDGIMRTMCDLGLAEIDMMSEHVENYLGAPVKLPGTGRPRPWARGTPNPPMQPQSQPGSNVAGSVPPPGVRRFAMDPAAREALRQLRLNVDLGKFREITKRFTDAGLKFFSYNLSFNETFSDEEIEKGMLMARALGTHIITASSPVSIFTRVAPFAEKHDVIVAMHNHTNGPEDFAEAMAVSKNIWVNLDIGHFVASGYDPISYIKDHHSRITNIHIKDRKKDRGPEMPFGEGDTPLPEVLRLVQRERYDFPVCIEYVGPDGPPVELKRCLDYCKRVLRGDTAVAS